MLKMSESGPKQMEDDMVTAKKHKRKPNFASEELAIVLESLQLHNEMGDSRNLT